MSSAAVQRVVVRMLHDPALVEAVYADAEAALAGLDLSDQERAWPMSTSAFVSGLRPFRS